MLAAACVCCCACLVLCTFVRDTTKRAAYLRLRAVVVVHASCRAGWLSCIFLNTIKTDSNHLQRLRFPTDRLISLTLKVGITPAGRFLEAALYGNIAETLCFPLILYRTTGIFAALIRFAKDFILAANSGSMGGSGKAISMYIGVHHSSQAFTSKGRFECG